MITVFAASVLLLFLKMLAISCYQGYYRLRHLTFVNAEDAAVLGRTAAAQERPEVRRAAQAWANDLENIPLFFVLGGLAITLHTPELPTLWLCALFTAARLAHTLAYLAAWQPWRTLAFAVGLGCLLGLAGMIAARLF
ncbi:MAPEG family protein [Pseudomonas sichuanensis]|uniref:MAPEG family protein n=1 Tax=Pseudomonas sichuanensis TaxID=2213015 RepID=UPI002ABA34CC|nr:MAPEG family protein [Pseudomonas sichuanensis]MDZ4021457.1 hypothetical protein [Pseudomonas sichuanensis]